MEQSTNNHCFANHDRIAELNLYDGKADRYFSGSPVPLAEELRTWALGETEAISSVTYPRERPYYVELSPEKTLPYELETIEIDTCYNKIFTPEMVAGHWKMASINRYFLINSNDYKLQQPHKLYPLKILHFHIKNLFNYLMHIIIPILS